VLTSESDANMRAGGTGPKPAKNQAIQWRTVVVRHRILESPYTVALVLGSVNADTPLPEFTPGQFVWVGVSMPDDACHVLQYSLWTTSEPGNLRITVKLVGGDRDAQLAREASNFIHYHVFDGDRLEVGFPPCSLSPSATARSAADLISGPIRNRARTRRWFSRSRFA